MADARWPIGRQVGEADSIQVDAHPAAPQPVRPLGLALGVDGGGAGGRAGRAGGGRQPQHRAFQPQVVRRGRDGEFGAVGGDPPARAEIDHGTLGGERYLRLFQAETVQGFRHAEAGPQPEVPQQPHRQGGKCRGPGLRRQRHRPQSGQLGGLDRLGGQIERDLPVGIAVQHLAGHGQRGAGHRGVGARQHQPGFAEVQRAAGDIGRHRQAGEGQPPRLPRGAMAKVERTGPGSEPRPYPLGSRRGIELRGGREADRCIEQGQRGQWRPGRGEFGRPQRRQAHAGGQPHRHAIRGGIQPDLDGEAGGFERRLALPRQPSGHGTADVDLRVDQCPAPAGGGLQQGESAADHLQPAQRGIAVLIGRRAHEVGEQGQRVRPGRRGRLRCAGPVGRQADAAVGCQQGDHLRPTQLDGRRRQGAAQQRPGGQGDRGFRQHRLDCPVGPQQPGIRKPDIERRRGAAAEAVPGDGGAADAQAGSVGTAVEAGLDLPGEEGHLQRPLGQPPGQPAERQRQDQHGGQRQAGGTPQPGGEPGRSPA